MELGAGAGLPSILSVLLGAELVVATDFPDKQIIENLRRNVAANVPRLEQSKIHICAHRWGDIASSDAIFQKHGLFDTVFLADLVSWR